MPICFDWKWLLPNSSETVTDRWHKWMLLCSERSFQRYIALVCTTFGYSSINGSGEYRDLENFQSVIDGFLKPLPAGSHCIWSLRFLSFSNGYDYNSEWYKEANMAVRDTSRYCKWHTAFFASSTLDLPEAIAPVAFIFCPLAVVMM